VETTGRSRGEREGGKLRAVRPQVELMARPDDIPEKLTHDISDLGLGAVFLASELELPEGVEPGYKADFAVYQIAVPRGAAAKGKG
jgi:large subunit ribosomal protein L25